MRLSTHADSDSRSGRYRRSHCCPIYQAFENGIGIGSASDIERSATDNDSREDKTMTRAEFIVLANIIMDEYIDGKQGWAEMISRLEFIRDRFQTEKAKRG